MIRLLLLGPLAIERDGQSVDVHGLPKPKLLALIAYLSAADDARPRSRDTLLGLLWPEREEESARHALRDRKSTRLNSSHPSISYAVFCLKKKKQKHHALSSRPAL